MKNVMYFENGIKHEFTADEMKLLCIAVRGLDFSTIPLCDEEREKEYNKAVENLKSLFLEHLDCPG